MTRPYDRARGCWEWIEEEDGRAAGSARTFIDVESGGWPVHAPCPKQRVAKPGGANRSTEIIFKKKKVINKRNNI